MTKTEIKQLRGVIGITQRQLAEYLGVDKATINRWESGATKIRSDTHVELLEILAERFHDDPDVIRSQFARGKRVNIRFIGRNCIRKLNPELQPETHTAS